MRRALILAALTAAPIAATPSSAPPQPRRGGVEVVTIRTDDDLDLGATFYVPTRDRAPAVLLVHDAGADRSQLADLADRLQQLGFGVLTLDIRGHGASKSAKLDWSKLDADAQTALWQLAPRDVEAGAHWILSRSEIHSTNLSLIGYRAGCALVARHAERDENVICMALLSPKPSEFGFDVEGALRNLDGLPTYVLDRRNDETERLISEANARTQHPYIEFTFVPRKSATVLDDRATRSKIAKWINDTAGPRRGRR